jgi:hypothetical protein
MSARVWRMTSTDMQDDASIRFGDHVRIRRHPDTEAAGLAGHIGEVRGVTTPSITAVTVVGPSESDCAFNVYVERLNREGWFSPELLELVGHAPGTTITLVGVAKTWTRTSDGDWTESPRRLPPREWWPRFQQMFRRSGKS